MRTRIVTALAALAVVSAPHPAAQSPVPRFEVASVKANRSGDLRVSLQPQPGGRFTATNVPLRLLILYAYQLQPFAIDGGPSWISSDRFDVTARAEGATSAEQTRAMVQDLLAERFKLVVHGETRDMPIYALTLARSDGRLGPQLRRSEVDCAATPSGAPQPGVINGGGRGAIDASPQCGVLGPAPGLPLSRGRFAFRGMSIDGLTRMMAPMVRRSVVDRTGLTGYFDGEFDATIELPPPPPPPGVPDPFDRQSFPSIFTVAREQLGLKLEPARGSVEVLVVDRAMPPTED